jgi:serine protease AprX
MRRLAPFVKGAPPAIIKARMDGLSRTRIGIASALAGLAFLGLLSAARGAPARRPRNVAPEVWEATAGEDRVEFLVVLAEQADLRSAAGLAGREERISLVYHELKELAERSQRPLREELDRAGVPYQPFYVVNMILVEGDRTLLSRLAARREVENVVANPHVRQLLPPSQEPAQERAPLGVEWGVARVNADDLWAQGYTGQGVIIGGQDTGYDWDHPALIGQYRGHNGITTTHDYNWHDAIHSGGGVCGPDSAVPCDDDGHGTHTMGTMVGDDGAGNQIGVAPGAKWIGCRNMDRGVGTPATYAECFQFFLAPYPVGGDPFADGDPSMAPHVINNSWTCPPSEGCSWDTLQAIVENVRAAGILVVASAGNSGSSCSTVRDPPAIYEAAFSVGATDSSDTIALFSSRGPVTVDGSQRGKPDVSAPGVVVRSCLPGTSYSYKSGTSMAGPHVAGTAALLWSAQPCLMGEVETSEWIIEQSARARADTTCGGDPSGRPNNVYGWGIVDALAAVELARTGLQIGKQGAFSPGLRPDQLIYTIGLTATGCSTFTQVVITDAVPLNATFAWASTPYTLAGGVVTWTVPTLAHGSVLTTTVAVTIAHLVPGTAVVNQSYGVRASEQVTPLMGAPLEKVVPWRTVLSVLFREWPAP